ncbi:MAG: tRNA pseudouridine(55) synthase TruB [Oscillospiraceae bacterium]|nr:tRNA pseudouridine(55) synthase TruB [Oscillospiraceae bacterium]
MNGIIIIDKPGGWTSHDTVAKLRGLLGERRVGHGGTLDPMATGVLPVFTGRATRAVSFLPGDKEYQAVLRLGMTTDTQDITGKVITSCDNSVSLQQVVEAANGFLGDVMQTPPMVSAVKVGGRRLYSLAREGIEVERAARPVTFGRIGVTHIAGHDYALDVSCSGGTYIRTLCHDIGRRLGCGGVLARLRRVRCGPFTLDGALTLEQVAAASGRASLLLPADSLFSALPAVTATPAQRERILHGGRYTIRDTSDGDYRVYSQDGVFLMLGRVREGVMETVKSFFDV